MKKVAVIKNNFDILRIIEGKSNGDTCEFKIIPKFNTDKLKVSFIKMFSFEEEFIFDKSRKIEITYHKSNGIQPTKIHLKLINKNNDKDYLYRTIPINRLLDPNVNTEFPIPLFRITIPDICLDTIYEKEPNHVVFDINTSNYIEIFMTRHGFIESDFYNKWKNTSTCLIFSSMEYFTNGCCYFMNKNVNLMLEQSKRENDKVLSSFATDVTKDIGLFINTVNNLNINKDYSEMLFIENEFYIPLCAAARMLDEDKIMKPAYIFDLKNSKYFSLDERKKWEYRFNKEIKKFDKYIKSHYIKYKMINKYYDGR